MFVLAAYKVSTNSEFDMQLEVEREKLHMLASNLGFAHPKVLRQSQVVDRLVYIQLT